MSSEGNLAVVIEQAIACIENGTRRLVEDGVVTIKEPTSTETQSWKTVALYTLLKMTYGQEVPYNLLQQATHQCITRARIPDVPNASPSPTLIASDTNGTLSVRGYIFKGANIADLNMACTIEHSLRPDKPFDTKLFRIGVTGTTPSNAHVGIVSPWTFSTTLSKVSVQHFTEEPIRYTPEFSYEANGICLIPMPPICPFFPPRMLRFCLSLDHPWPMINSLFSKISHKMQPISAIVFDVAFDPTLFATDSRIYAKTDCSNASDANLALKTDTQSGALLQTKPYDTRHEDGPFLNSEEVHTCGSSQAVTENHGSQLIAGSPVPPLGYYDGSHAVVPSSSLTGVAMRYESPISTPFTTVPSVVVTRPSDIEINVGPTPQARADLWINGGGDRREAPDVLPLHRRFHHKAEISSRSG